METLILYELSQLDWWWERITESIWFFKSKEIAEQVKKNAFQTINKTTINIFDSKEDFKYFENEELKKSALSKLTKEEKEALWL